MNLGLEALKSTFVDDTFMGTEDDLRHAEDLIDSTLAAEFEASRTIDQLRFVHGVLAASTDVTALAPVFTADENFITLFGDDSSKWADNVRAKITEIEASEEGMKLQDFLRWNVFGLAFGAYLSSLGVIRKRITEKLQLYPKEGTPKNRSLYLPEYSKASSVINGVVALQKGIKSVIANPKGAKIEDFDAALKACGLVRDANNKAKGHISTDWKAVGGQWLGGLLGLVPIPGLGIIGAIGGAHALSDNGKPIADRGWTYANLETVGKQILGVLNDASNLEAGVKNMGKSIDADGMTPEEKANVKAVAAYLKRVIKLYQGLVSSIGRGMAAAL